MVIEWLKVNVDAAAREQYIQTDAEIWTEGLSQYPGFLRKEVWINPENQSEVILVIRWASFEQWDSIPPDALQEIDTRFNEAMGEVNHQIVEEGRYQVRKFS